MSKTGNLKKGVKFERDYKEVGQLYRCAASKIVGIGVTAPGPIDGCDDKFL